MRYAAIATCDKRRQGGGVPSLTRAQCVAHSLRFAATVDGTGGAAKPLYIAGFDTGKEGAAGRIALFSVSHTDEVHEKTSC